MNYKTIFRLSFGVTVIIAAVLIYTLFFGEDNRNSENDNTNFVTQILVSAGIVSASVAFWTITKIE